MLLSWINYNLISKYQTGEHSLKLISCFYILGGEFLSFGDEFNTFSANDPSICVIIFRFKYLCYCYSFIIIIVIIARICINCNFVKKNPNMSKTSFEHKEYFENGLCFWKSVCSSVIWTLLTFRTSSFVFHFWMNCPFKCSTSVTFKPGSNMKAHLRDVFSAGMHHALIVGVSMRSV